jgi:methionyl-tRNA formyltransferase
VVGRFNPIDGILKELAEESGLPFWLNKNINSNDFLDLVKPFQCHLFTCLSFNQIFRSRLIEFPEFGIINCHAGKLPFYRGRNILNWALINDEKEFGVTAHFIDEGIDTGDIVLQRSFPINDSDDYNTLLKCAHVECASTLYDAVKLIQAGTYSRIKQTDIHALGTYFPKRISGDENLNWDQSSREIFNFVRAICFPGPEARTMLAGEVIRISEVQYFEGAPVFKGIPGSIIGKTSSTFDVKTRDSFVRVIAWKGNVAIRIGDRLE